MDFRKACFYTLHTPYTRASKLVNGIIMFLIIVSIALIPLSLFNVFGLDDQYHDQIIFFERITVTIFTIEYLLRIYSAPNAWLYIASWWGIIDLVAILPFFLAGVIPVEHVEIFTLLRVLRILKLAKINVIDHASAIRECKEKGHGHFTPLADEEVERIIQKHPVIFIVGLIMPLTLTSIGLMSMMLFGANPLGIAVTILFFVFAGVFFAKAWLDFMYDVIYITDQRVVIQNRRLFGIVSNDISYTSITNVSPDNRGLIQWMIGFGRVMVQTASGDTPIFEGAPKPQKVVSKIINNRQKVIQELKESSQNNARMLSEH